MQTGRDACLPVNGRAWIVARIEKETLGEAAQTAYAEGRDTSYLLVGKFFEFFGPPSTTPIPCGSSAAGQRRLFTRLTRSGTWVEPGFCCKRGTTRK